MNKFKRLVEIFEDENNRLSSKRIAGFICIMSLVFTLMYSTVFCKNLQINTTLIESIALFSFGAFGLTSVDKYVSVREKRLLNKDKEQDETTA
jgi:hypothetical protein